MGTRSSLRASELIFASILLLLAAVTARGTRMQEERSPMVQRLPVSRLAPSSSGRLEPTDYQGPFSSYRTGNVVYLKPPERTWTDSGRRELADYQATLPYYWTGDIIPQTQSESYASDSGRQELADYQTMLPVYYAGP